jgi:hypothetical protein
MKTNLLYKKLFLLPAVIMLSALNVFAQQNTEHFEYTALRGVVLDSTTKEPLIFASVFIKGTNLGTVSNSNGKFLIKIPGKYAGNTIGISMIGYKTKYLLPSDFNKINNKILLQPEVIPMPEVVIRELVPIQLVMAARDKIDENYSNKPVMMTGFYREWIKKRKQYMEVGEAVLNIYKAAYDDMSDFDKVSVYKGRKGKTAKRMDTLLVKIQGGPLTFSYLDIVKRPADILSEDMIYNYDFYLDDILMVDGRETYKIDFKEKENVQVPLYDGKIFIDVKSLAIVALEFKIPDDRLQASVKYLIKKKPFNLKVDLLGANYMTKYREINGKWYLNYVRAETRYRFKWKKRLFSSLYTIASETAITDIDTMHVEKPKYRNRIKTNYIFSDKISDLEDVDFWGADNIIEPEESIRKAIQKISRKLNRNR